MKEEQIKAVIFDWGGVVAPNKNDGWVGQLAKLLNIDFEYALELWRECSPGLSTGKISEDDFWNLIKQKTTQFLPRNKSDIWLKGLADIPYPEIIDYIGDLKNQRIKTVILSNTIEPMERITDLDGMYENFDLAVLSHRAGLAKPDTKIFEFTTSKLGLQPTECIFIDDSIKNIESAKALGFNTIQVENDPNKTISSIKAFL